MNAINQFLGNLFVPGMILIGVIALIAVIVIVARNYIKVPPNRAAFFYGKGAKRHRVRTVTREATDERPGEVYTEARFLPRAVTVVTGGAKLRIPMLQEVAFLDLTEITIEDLNVGDVPNIDGVLVSVDAVANVKFRSDEESLLAAGERFLGKSPSEVRTFVLKTLEAHLRGIVGNMKVEEMIRDRQKFQQEVLDEAGKALAKVGMQVDILNIQNITDKQGYIRALGRARTAQIIRDAEIGEAQAQRESTIQATNAHREAEVIKQQNIAREAEADKEKNVAVAKYNAETTAEQARASQAGPRADAQARQEVIHEQVRVEEERVKAQIAVEAQEILKEQKAQEARTVVPARAHADAVVAEAEGYKKSAMLKAEGERFAEIAHAEAEQKKFELEGKGEGEAIKAKGIGEGEAIKAQLLARAEGLLKVAAAYKEFNQAALQLETLKIMPQVIEAIAPVFSAIAAPLGNIDRLTVYDIGGGGSGDSGSALTRFAGIAPNIVFDFLQKAKAVGLDVSGLLEKMGITPEEIERQARDAAARAKSRGTSPQAG
jgi:flotillin